MIQKIITHNGIFHADETMAIALIHELVNVIPVERTRNISVEDYNNPKIWVIDVGGKIDGNNNYDHHQDASLPASCVLVLDALLEHAYISIDLYEELLPSMMEISHIDCNGPADRNGFQFNSLIKSFNALDGGFDVAVQVSRSYVASCKMNLAKSTESLAIWEMGEKISMYIRVCDAFPIHWKKYNEAPFLIYPNDGKWNLLSINSECFPIISTGKEEFIHNGKFIAVFRDKDDAIQSAQMSAYNVVG